MARVLPAEGEDEDAGQGRAVVNRQEQVPLSRGVHRPHHVVQVSSRPPYGETGLALGRASYIQPKNVLQAPSKSSGSTTSTPSFAALRTP